MAASSTDNLILTARKHFEESGACLKLTDEVPLWEVIPCRLREAVVSSVRKIISFYSNLTITDEEELPLSTGDKIPWNHTTGMLVLTYVIKVISTSGQGILLNDTLTYLDLILEEKTRLDPFILSGYDRLSIEMARCHRVVIPPPIHQIAQEMARADRLKAAVWRLHDQKRFCDEIFKEMFVYGFIPELQRPFTVVPKLHQLSSSQNDKLKPNEIMAGFISFLDQILFVESLGVQEEKRYTHLRKELTYLISFLGDKPFQCIHHHHELQQQVNNILADFEIVASETGHFIHSLVLSVHPVKVNWFYAQRYAFVEKFKSLKAKVAKHCIRFSALAVNLATMSDVVGSFSIVDSLIGELGSIMDGQRILTTDETIWDHIKTLHAELALISQTFLLGSPELQEKYSDEFRETLLQIADLAYEAEYVINYHVAGNIPDWYLDIRLPGIVKKIKLTCETLRKMEKTCISKHIRYSDTGNVSSWPTQTSVAAGDDNLCLGSEDSMNMILDDLIGRPRSPRKVIAIHGMPGLGKTTIASKLYDCPSTSCYFDRRAWCVVSQAYTVRKLLIQILVSITDEPDMDKILKTEDAVLGVDIHKTLKQRRYLIALDDVWHSDVWDALGIYFPDDGNGSRVILTSRIRDAAPNDSIFHTPRLLSDHQCWDVMKRKVFSTEPCPPELLSLGKRIAAKCSGLPLAVVVTGGILAKLEKEKCVWERVERELDTFLLDGQKSNYREILELSYSHLPHSLKPCFLYFAVFGDVREISVRKLVWLWMAEGFIPKVNEREPEEIAEMYLLDLIDRSLMMIAERRRNGEIKTCRIHDMLHDICVWKANEENFVKCIDKDDISIYETHERLCIGSTSATYRKYCGPHCRSVVSHCPCKYSYFGEMPLLKVMDLTSLECKSNAVLHLDPPPIHLRYLSVYPMPATRILENLVDLEFLCLHHQSGIDLPMEMILKMVKLRHVRITPSVTFTAELCNSTRTTNLRSLTRVAIYSQEGSQIVRFSPNLRKLKCLLHGNNGSEVQDLHYLTKLESLNMRFRFSLDEIALSKVNFPLTIKKLCLVGAGLPWEKMSVIGRLPNLHVLKLLEGAFRGEAWETRDDEFQELRFLMVEDCDLKQWSSFSEHFPQLECLVLDKCRGLEEIPNDLGYISTLQKIEVRYSSKEAYLSAVQIEEEQHVNGNEELQVIICDYKWAKEQLVQEYRKQNEEGNRGEDSSD